MEYVVMIGQLILSLSILIVLHEGGHFLPAKLFGARVEKFYLFFDAGFSLFKYQKGETEYGIGWLPLGGYVKISGMIDESMDLEQMKQPPQEWEFRSKPAWQRLIIMLGGVTVNFILGLLLFAMLLFVWGEEYMPAKNAKYGIHADSLGMQMGLQSGDQILSVGDVKFEKFNDRTLVREIVINGADKVKVNRNGQEIDLKVPEDFTKVLTNYDNKEKRLFTIRFPFVAGEIVKGGPAEKAGFLKNDSIVGINNIPTPFFDQFYDQITKNVNKKVTVNIFRDGAAKNIELTTDENGHMKVKPYPPTKFFDAERQEYTLIESIPAGAKQGWNFLADQVKAFGRIFSGKIAAKDSLGGFASIGKMYGGEWIWERFWKMTAILSLILAFMNLLPIPALDGGHVMFLLYEVVTGRKPSDKFLEYSTIVGFVIVFALLIFANGLDIWRAIKHWF